MFLGEIESVYTVTEVVNCLKLLNIGYLLSGGGSGGTDANTIKLWNLSVPNSAPIKKIKNTNSINALAVLSMLFENNSFFSKKKFIHKKIFSQKKKKEGNTSLISRPLSPKILLKIIK